MAAPKKKVVPTAEQTQAEAATFETPVAPATPVKTGTKAKAVIDNKIVDVVEDNRYPRHSVSDNYQVEVISPLTSVPMVRVSPRGWVGPAPLTIPESRLDEVIELLTKVR